MKDCKNCFRIELDFIEVEIKKLHSRKHFEKGKQPISLIQRSKVMRILKIARSGKIPENY